MIGVYCEKQTQNEELLIVKAGGTYSYQRAFEGL
jgi:hypothetical protein